MTCIRDSAPVKDDCSTQILGASAGYGAGKTRALAAKTLSMAAANQGFTGCVHGANRTAHPRHLDE